MPLKAYNLTQARAGCLEQVDVGDEQWTHLPRPVLQLVCDYDVLLYSFIHLNLPEVEHASSLFCV